MVLFKDEDIEHDYVRRPDSAFRFSILCITMIFICVGIVQLVIMPRYVTFITFAISRVVLDSPPTSSIFPLRRQKINQVIKSSCSEYTPSPGYWEYDIIKMAERQGHT